MSDQQLEKLPPAAEVINPTNNSVDMRHEQINFPQGTMVTESKAVQDLPKFDIDNEDLQKKHGDAMRVLVNDKFDQIDTNHDGLIMPNELSRYRDVVLLTEDKPAVKVKNLDILQSAAEYGIKHSLHEYFKPWHEPIGLTKAQALEVSDLVRNYNGRFTSFISWKSVK